MKFINQIFLFSLFILALTTLSRDVNAAKPSTAYKTFQITSDGAQQNGPLIWGDTVVWTDWRGSSGLDIWTYNIKTKKESLLISNPNNQRVYGIWKDKIIYRDENTTPASMKVFNMKTRQYTQIATGDDVVGGAVFGDNAFYVDGAGGGNLYTYNLVTGESRFLTNNVYVPKVWCDKIVWTVHLGGGNYGIKGYDLVNDTAFDISSKNDGYQSAPDIFEDMVVWLDSSDGKSRIMEKHLISGSERVVVEVEGTRLSYPMISNQYITWVDNMGAGAHDIYAYSNVGNKILRLSDFGPQQSSPTIPDLSGNTVVWMSWHTGNGDIYGATLSH